MKHATGNCFNHIPTLSLTLPEVVRIVAYQSSQLQKHQSFDLFSLATGIDYQLSAPVCVQVGKAVKAAASLLDSTASSLSMLLRQYPLGRLAVLLYLLFIHAYIYYLLGETLIMMHKMRRHRKKARDCEAPNITARRLEHQYQHARHDSTFPKF